MSVEGRRIMKLAIGILEGNVGGICRLLMLQVVRGVAGGSVMGLCWCIGVSMVDGMRVQRRGEEAEGLLLVVGMSFVAHSGSDVEDDDRDEEGS
jgi:hypothetical protein